MKVTGVELRRLAMPLAAPFRTSVGTMTDRDVLLVRVVTPDGDGWGECAADLEPRYTPEYVAGEADVLRRFLVPAVTALPVVDTAHVAPVLAAFRGHRSAKAALETAVLDAELKSIGMSLADYLGAARPRVPCGVSVGVMDSVPQLLDAVADYLEQGYVRIKLKIEPGWDVEPVRAVRERFGGDLALQVDANTAYTLADARHLARLDDFDLLMIEQPLAADALRAHAALAGMLRTPICLDESIQSAQQAADAISLGACRIVNLKPGRVGGLLECRRIHDLCRAHGVPVWCGGMLESGVGRAALLALAALPGCVFPGDTSASDRYFRTDITVPFVLDDGHLPVPAGPGIGLEPLAEEMAAVTTKVEWLPSG